MLPDQALAPADFWKTLEKHMLFMATDFSRDLKNLPSAYITR